MVLVDLAVQIKRSDLSCCCRGRRSAVCATCLTQGSEIPRDLCSDEAIAVLRNEKTGQYRLCPIFDNGLSFLSDLKDYPLDADLYANIGKVDAKPFSRDFLMQQETASALYGSHLHFDVKHQDVDELLDGLEEYYSEEILNRARGVLLEQMRKFQYLF